MTYKEDVLFSIIIPTFNRAILISKAIQSVIDQRYTNWELIIVDDGSSDNTKEVVANFNDNRIKYFFKINEERGIARNFGIDKAGGDYISFLDDDDYYLPEFLEEFYLKISHCTFPVAVFMSNEYIEVNGLKKEKIIPVNLLNNPVRLIWNFEPGIRPFVIHKKILKKEKFPKGFKYGEDLHLTVRAALGYDFFLINKPLYIFHSHIDQGVQKKFRSNIKENAYNSIGCVIDLINIKPEIFKFIHYNEVFDKLNHKVYGFSSAAMKNFDFLLCFDLIRKFSLKGSKIKLLYYILSLFGRLPFYYLKYIIS